MFSLAELKEITCLSQSSTGHANSDEWGAKYSYPIILRHLTVDSHSIQKSICTESDVCALM